MTLNNFIILKLCSRIKIGILMVLASTVVTIANTNRVNTNEAKIPQYLLSKSSSNVLINMNLPMSQLIQSYSTKFFNTREERVTEMVSEMQSLSTQNQAPVLQVLKPLGVKTESYWVTNQIFLENANPSILQKLVQLSEVHSITEERPFPMIPIIGKYIAPPPNGTFWSLKKVQADKVWSKGVEGEGVVVGSIDSGARSSHESIRENYVGTQKYGWYDPILYTFEPSDSIGHGTHTIGTMVGKKGIGIAPKAKWMACRACLGTCAPHHLLACGQFMLCPSNHNGISNKKCSGMPNIINNSWGGGSRTSRFYDDVVNAWKVAGIIAYFANGNGGPDCETALYPGDLDYPITVGSTDISDTLSNFSSRGPKILETDSEDTNFFTVIMKLLVKKKRNTYQATNIIKPEITAPGDDIMSAGIASDISYALMSGTSMASPLVAGAGALLLSAYPDLNMKQMKVLMYSTADRKLGATNTQQCGNVSETQFPNHLYGFGRLNIYKAYEKLVRLDKQDKLDELADKNESSSEEEETEEEER